jgi:hypothetical protein
MGLIHCGRSGGEWARYGAWTRDWLTCFSSWTSYLTLSLRKAAAETPKVCEGIASEAAKAIKRNGDVAYRDDSLSQFWIPESAV